MAVSGAKERNLTVGDWLAEIIVLNRKNHTADDKTNLPTRPLPDLIELVDTMNERLTAMESERSQPLLKRLLGRRKAA